MIENATDFAQEIETALATNPYLSSRQLRFENKEGRLVLKGTVDSYFQKQIH